MIYKFKCSQYKKQEGTDLYFLIWNILQVTLLNKKQKICNCEYMLPLIKGDGEKKQRRHSYVCLHLHRKSLKGFKINYSRKSSEKDLFFSRQPILLFYFFTILFFQSTHFTCGKLFIKTVN